MSQTYSTRQRPRSGGQVYSTRQPQHAAAPRPAVQSPPAVAVADPQVQGAAPQWPAAAPQVQGVLPQLPGVLAQAPGAAGVSLPVAAPAPEQQFTFALTGQGLPVAQRHTPNASGQVSVRGRAGAPAQVQASFTGLNPPRDPSSRPTLWLIHDLRVPADLSPADLAMLPRAAQGANMPGTVFTIDGKAPTSGWTVL